MPPRSLEPDRDLSPVQVGRLCGLSCHTVRRVMTRGLLKGYQIPGTRHRRFRPPDVLAFLECHQMPVPDALRRLAHKYTESRR